MSSSRNAEGKIADLPKEAAGTSAARKPDFAYRAFISYANRTDYAHARSLEGFLESVHTQVPGSAELKPLQICRDGSDFKLPRDDRGQVSELPETIWPIIRTELEHSEQLLLLCSPMAAHSPWVRKEVEWFLDQRGPQNIRLAVTLGDPNTPEDVFPEPIRAAKLHERQIWYDLREFGGVRLKGARHYRDERARLAADLLRWVPQNGEQFSALLHQARRKQQLRRALWWAGGAMISGVLAVLLWSFAMDRRRQSALEAMSDADVVVEILDDGVGLLFPREMLADEIDKLLQGAPSLGSVSALDLDGTAADDRVVQRLATDLPTLRHLLLRETRVTDAGVQAISDLRALEELRLAQNTAVTDASVNALSLLSELRILELMSTRVTAASLPRLAPLSKLEYLDLDSIPLAEVDLTPLMSLSRLRTLDIRRTNMVPEELARLSELPLLEHLILGGNSLQDDDLRHLAGFKALTELSLIGNGITGGGIAYLAEMDSLETLYLSNNPISSDFAESLLLLESLAVLFIENSGIDDTLSAELAQLQSISQLWVSDNPLSDRGLQAICEMQSLRFLALRGTKITDAGLDCLAQLPHLTDLHLGRTTLTDASISAIANVKGLQRLWIGNTSVTIDGVHRLRELFPALKLASDY